MTATPTGGEGTLGRCGRLAESPAITGYFPQAFQSRAIEPFRPFSSLPHLKATPTQHPPRLATVVPLHPPRLPTLWPPLSRTCLVPLTPHPRVQLWDSVCCRALLIGTGSDSPRLSVHNDGHSYRRGGGTWCRGRLPSSAGYRAHRAMRPQCAPSMDHWGQRLTRARVRFRLEVVRGSPWSICPIARSHPVPHQGPELSLASPDVLTSVCHQLRWVEHSCLQPMRRPWH